MESMTMRVLAYLFVRYLDQETVKCPFQSSSQAVTCYYQSNHSKVKPVSFKRLSQGHNKRTCPLIFTLSLFMLNVEQENYEY